MKLVALEVVIAGKSARWRARQCRDGRIPGARKIGQAWFVDVEVFSAANDAKVETLTAPTVAEAFADLQVRGMR